MNEAAKQAGRVVESVAGALANWAVARHAELDPELETRYGPTWREDWVGHVDSQLRFLAQSLAVRRAKLFVDAVQWMKAAFQARGARGQDLVTSLRCMREVVEAELPAEVAGPAADYVGLAIKQLEVEPAGETPSLRADTPHHKLALRYLEALLEGRRQRAETLIFEAIEHGTPIRDIYENVLQPAQNQIGVMWQAGEIGVADEHLASATTLSIMSVLRSRFTGKNGNGKRVVAASIGGELHEIGVRMVADFFEMNHWNVIYLGANTPAADIVSAVRTHEADLLAVSTSTAMHVRAVGELIEQIRDDKSCARTKVLVGGPPFVSVPDLWVELGADGSAPSAAKAVELGDSLTGDRSHESFDDLEAP